MDVYARRCVDAWETCASLPGVILFSRRSVTVIESYLYFVGTSTVTDTSFQVGPYRDDVSSAFACTYVPPFLLDEIGYKNCTLTQGYPLVALEESVLAKYLIVTVFLPEAYAYVVVPLPVPELPTEKQDERPPHAEVPVFTLGYHDDWVLPVPVFPQPIVPWLPSPFLSMLSHAKACC